tara:strand:+ start:381 stop:668 length:288 start_codon:yes stop_codon:yes gene_type:complete
MTEKPYSDKQYKIAKLFWFIFFLPILHLVRISGILIREPNKFIKYIFSIEIAKIFVPALTVYVLHQSTNLPLWLLIYFECHIYERFLFNPNYDPK